MATAAATSVRHETAVANLGLRNGDISSVIGAAFKSAF
jgi:hypothetical protein